MSFVRVRRSCKGGERMQIPSLQTESRKIVVAVDLSDDSAYVIQWAVTNYLHADDNVILLHVQPTRSLHGADWGGDKNVKDSEEKAQDNLDAFRSNRLTDMATPILDAEIALKIHIVKDHDIKERICLETQRLGADAVIMGTRGFGSCGVSLGKLTAYCVAHCRCPVVLVPCCAGKHQASDVRRLLRSLVLCSSLLGVRERLVSLCSLKKEKAE